jgi:hypothetical protein
MSKADQIRQHVITRHIAPARERGDETITIRVGDVAGEMNLKKTPSRILPVLLARTSFRKWLTFRRSTKSVPGLPRRTVFKHAPDGLEVRPSRPVRCRNNARVPVKNLKPSQILARTILPRPIHPGIK